LGNWPIPFQAWTLVVLLLAAAVAFVCGLTISSEAHFIAAALAGLCLLGVIWPLITMRGIRGEISFSRGRCSEGQPVDVEVTLWNRWPWPAWGVSIEQGFLGTTQSKADSSEIVVSLARIPGWTKSKFHWSFIAECRGTYPNTPPKIRTEFPFGVTRRERTITVPEKIIVWPAALSAQRGFESRGEAASLVALSTRKSGSEGEFVSARPFRHGDRLRHVHWSLTARYDRLIVTEHQGHGQSGATVELCRDPSRAWNADPRGADEWSVRIMASLCEHLLTQNVQVRLVLNQTATEISGTPHDRRKAFDRLAHYSPIAKAADHQESRHANRATAHEPYFIVCTNLADLPQNRVQRSTVFLIQTGTYQFSSPDDLSRRVILLDPTQEMGHEFEQAWNLLADEVWHGQTT